MPHQPPTWRNLALVALAWIIGPEGSEAGARELTEITQLSQFAAGGAGSAGRVPTGFTLYTSRAAFEAAHPVLASEDFESASCSGILGFPAPVSVAAPGPCYGSDGIVAGIELRDDPLNDSGPGPDPGSIHGLALISAGELGALNDALVANTYVDAFVLELDPPVPTVGLVVVNFSVMSPMRVRFFRGATMITEHQVPGGVSTSGAFVGLHDPSLVSRVDLWTNDGAPGDGSEGLYELLFAPPLFADGFESQDTSAWSLTVP